jgi:hypothetical protein
VPDDKDTVERAKEIFVYGPIGLAMYVKDTAPSFLKVFVARGRAEVEQRRRTVGDQLGQVRNAGAAAGAAAAEGGPQVLRIVSDGLARVRETAEGALGVLGGLSGDLGASGERPSPAPRPEPAARGGGEEPPRGGRPADPGLAIADYDDLSASQVVDRLEGLEPGDLDAIRRHEVAHRARATIIGKIDQLTRPA